MSPVHLGQYLNKDRFDQDVNHLPSHSRPLFFFSLSHSDNIMLFLSTLFLALLPLGALAGKHQDKSLRSRHTNHARTLHVRNNTKSYVLQDMYTGQSFLKCVSQFRQSDIITDLSFLVIGISSPILTLPMAASISRRKIRR